MYRYFLFILFLGISKYSWCAEKKQASTQNMHSLQLISGSVATQNLLSCINNGKLKLDAAAHDALMKNIWRATLLQSIPKTPTNQSLLRR